MKLRNQWLSIPLLSIVLFSGCMENTSGDKEIALHVREKSTAPVKHIAKESRVVVQNDFDKNAVVWEYDNHEGLRVSVDATMLYIDFTHHTTAPNVQFFLDIDDNALTGNREEGGADYMVENGLLYASTAVNTWGWREVGRVKSVVDQGVSDAIAINLASLANKSVVFKVSAQALNTNWAPLVSSPRDGTKSIYSKEDNSIDWSQVPLYAQTNGVQVKLFSNHDNLYVSIIENSASAHTQIYIDSDNQAQTGYISDGWSAFGRDYLIEDGYLYHYSGVGSWGWDFVETVVKVRSQNGNNMLVFSIPKRKLGNLANSIKVGIETNSEDWSQTTLVPSNTPRSFSLNGNNPPPQAAAKIVISEVMASNSRTELDPDFEQFSDWIELHNTASSAVDLGGYIISNKLNELKWTFPSGTTIPEGGYLLLWADGKDTQESALHTNFKLKGKGGAVALFDRAGNSIDAFTYTKQRSDISVGFDKGTLFYMNPTPGFANGAHYSSAVLSDSVSFSKPSGFYDSSSVTLSASGTIYYTTDGSTPTSASARYAGPIFLNDTMSLRAISIENSKFTSAVGTETYLIGEGNLNMPVIAISTDDWYLNDSEVGIYTVGNNGATLPCGDNGEMMTANYFQKWERPAHMVFFEEDKRVVLSQDVGLKVSGSCSRRSAQKSLQLKASSKYGKKSFDYQIFPDKSIYKFERIKLRNAGQDVTKTHFRDALAHRIAQNQMHLDYEAYRPAVVFLNGEYWGIYSIREKFGKAYLKENHGVSKKVDILEDEYDLKEGDSGDYDTLIAYVRTHSLASSAGYQYVADRINVDNFIDYMITNMYIGNSDWPGTNIVYWKEKKAGAKWQWHLHDMDFAFGLFELSPVEYNSIEVATTVSQADWPNPEWSTLLLRKLLENVWFKQTFKNRFEALLNSTFAPNRTSAILTDMSNKIAPQMARHINRWTINGTYGYDVQDFADWRTEVEAIRTYLYQRPSIIRTYLRGL